MGTIKTMEHFYDAEFLGVEFALQKAANTKNSFTTRQREMSWVLSLGYIQLCGLPRDHQNDIDLGASKVLSEKINSASYSEIKDFWSQINLSIYHISLLKTQTCYI